MNSLVVDVGKCTACMVCKLACSFVHEGAFVPRLSRIRVERCLDRGLNAPVVCVNCDDAACVKRCPTGALTIDREAEVVRLRDEECIGCGECVEACPFGAISLRGEGETACKCDLCDGRPACVESCIYGALKYEALG